MRVRRTTILAAVAVLVASQTAIASQLCLANRNATACHPSCGTLRAPRERPSERAPETPTEHHPCCDENLVSKLAQVLPGKGAIRFNTNAANSAEHPADGAHLAADDATSFAWRDVPESAFIHQNSYILNLSLRC